MSHKDYQLIANKIIDARASAKAIAPFSPQFPEWGLDEAYQVQKIVNQHRLDLGGRVVGYKIGLTSLAVQQQLGVDQPDYGVLFSDMEIPSGTPISTEQLIAPKAEGEIGFCFKKDLDVEDLTLTELYSAIDFFFPVIEIVDSVVKDWKISIVDTVADNASSGMYIPGKKIFLPHNVDFENIELSIALNGEHYANGKGSACLGSPLVSCLWLAKKLNELGTPVKAGQIVLSGALAPMVAITSGCCIEFSFGMLGNITVATC